MSDVNLQNVLSAIDINADWVGLREVRETTTYRVIRDGNPQANSRNTDHGVMVEVLADGQFGYYGCNNLKHENIQKAAEKALRQAKAAAKNPIFKFTENSCIFFVTHLGQCSPKLLQKIFLGIIQLSRHP